MCRASCLDHWRSLLAASAAVASDAGAAVNRRTFLGLAAGGALAASGCASATPPSPSDAVRDLLAAAPSFDLHSHPGLFPSMASDTLAGHRRAAEAGAVKLIALTGTSDSPVLTRSSTGGLRASRQPRAGELYAATWQQLNALTTWSSAAAMPHVRSGKDLTTGAPSTAAVRGLLATEGCDFIEGRLERVQEAFDRGVRSMQLVHYRVNELGDIQTETPVHDGLTSFGRTVVRELNRLRIVVDVAHATFATTAGVAETSTRPIILSHSNIQDASGWPRFITRDHAQVVAKTGGVVGAMPIVLGRHRTSSTDIDSYVGHISRLVDVVGIDHVGIGTDMDGIGPAAIFTSYTRWPSLAAALLDRGYQRDDVTKILGGNAMRVFRTVLPEP